MLGGPIRGPQVAEESITRPHRSKQKQTCKLPQSFQKYTAKEHEVKFCY